MVLALRRIAAVFSLIAVASSPALSDENRSIVLQSTTSTQNSGLFDHILPEFTRRTGIEVRVVAVGTGQALNNGRNGDGDVILVHARNAEEEFVAAGHGIDRRDVMYNDFVLIGPRDNPAAIDGHGGILEALAKIAEAEAVFVSRGDDSGTHRRERELWEDAVSDARSLPESDWYRESGAGMGATLNIAAGMNAHTLTDRATWMAFENKADLQILSEGDPLLFNQYGVMLVNPTRHSHVKMEEGRQFMDWITGRDGQELIASYQLKGNQLFFPNAR